MYDELRSLRDKHGIFLRREAIALGYTDVHLARAVRHGSLTRLRHGSYMFRDEWDVLKGDKRHAVVAMAVLRTARTTLVLSHATAVVLHDAPTWSYLSTACMRRGRTAEGDAPRPG